MTPWTLVANDRDRYLAPHPWDALGKPPTPGYAYGIEGEVVRLRADLERAVDDAEDKAIEADRLDEEAQIARDESEEAEKKAAAIAKELTELGFGAQAQAVIDGKGWPE